MVQHTQGPGYGRDSYAKFKQRLIKSISFDGGEGAQSDTQPMGVWMDFFCRPSRDNLAKQRARFPFFFNPRLKRPRLVDIGFGYRDRGRICRSYEIVVGTVPVEIDS